MNEPISGADDLPARDLEMALANTDGDPALAAELFAMLLTGLPEDLARLRAALATADWSGLAEQAHQMRGATRYCGVPALDGALASLEQSARGLDAGASLNGVRLVEQQAQRLLTMSGSAHPS
ncbi:MAG: Hpt domain-containing protein [Sphingobacteriia bacterium]|nr:Hpt domain-containing protein [Sphingobacteriia bacterium]NCC37879.1 Hpt domain-containing protein [Gammaproteobacteria bacterium]